MASGLESFLSEIFMLNIFFLTITPAGRMKLQCGPSAVEPYLRLRFREEHRIYANMWQLF